MKIAEKLGKPKIELLIEKKNKLKEKPLITSKILNTEEYNIKPTLTGEGKEEYKVFIPTYKRYERVRDATLQTLERQGVPDNKIYIFVAGKDEEKKYRAVLGNRYKIVVGKRGLLKQLRFINNYFDKGEQLVRMDDDIKEIFKKVGKNKKKQINLDDFFRNAFKICKGKGAKLWGVHPSSNPFFMTKGISTDLRLIVGQCYGYIHTKEKKYDEFIVSTDKQYIVDDVERSIIYYKLDGVIVRFNDIGILSFPFYNPEGGIAEEVGGVEARKKIARRVIASLAKHYPEYGRVGVNKAVPDIPHFDLIRNPVIEKKEEITGSGKKDKFLKQLEELEMPPEVYLDVARRVAKREGYDPNKLHLSLNDDNKLKYESPEGLKHFGKAGYGDYILLTFKERNNDVPKGYADMKRRVFRKSHSAISDIHNLGKYSPNELAINILW